MKLEFHPKKTASIFFGITVALVMSHIILSILYYTFGGKFAKFFQRIMNPDNEKTIPTLFSAFLIFLCAVLLWVISRYNIQKKVKHGLYWRALSLIFLFLALDEGTQIHELVNDSMVILMKNTALSLKPERLFQTPWIFPYLIFSLTVALIFIPFLFQLPKRTRNLFLTSGVIYLVGAIVLEMFSMRQADLAGRISITHIGMYTVEEFLEMSGMVLFLYSLLDYITREIGPVSLTLKHKPTS
jgi:hypothetical protein